MNKLTPFVAIVREGLAWLYEWPAAGLIDELYRAPFYFPNGVLCAQINKGLSGGPWRTEMLLNQYGPGSYELSWDIIVGDVWPVETGATMLVFQTMPVAFDSADTWSGPNMQLVVENGRFVFSYRGDSSSETTSAPVTHELCSWPIVVDEVNSLVLRITPDFNRQGSIELNRNGEIIGKAVGVDNAFNNTNMNFFVKYGLYRWADFPPGVDMFRVYHSDMMVE